MRCWWSKRSPASHRWCCREREREQLTPSLSATHNDTHAAAGASDVVGVAGGSCHKTRSTSHTEQEVEWSMDGIEMIVSHVDQSLSA